eukprot:142691-Pelagomonas_calceolata.AAC.10
MYARSCTGLQGEKKPDMQAFSQLKHLTPTVMFGHVPGMRPGDVFKNRGELAVLGGHTQYSRGIDNRCAARPPLYFQEICGSSCHTFIFTRLGLGGVSCKECIPKFFIGTYRKTSSADLATLLHPEVEKALLKGLKSCHS